MRRQHSRIFLMPKGFRRFVPLAMSTLLAGLVACSHSTTPTCSSGSTTGSNASSSSMWGFSNTQQFQSHIRGLVTTYTNQGYNKAARFEDYDGDGVSDFAIFDPGTGKWNIALSTGQYGSLQFGPSNGKAIPVPGDYDGDGKTDLAIYDPSVTNANQSNPNWFIAFSTGNGNSFAYGAANWKPVVGDYDGDGKTDVGIFDPTTDTWYISYSSGRTALKQQFGEANVDIPVPADYDGDGKTDIAVYRPTTATWYIQYSGGGGAQTQFGAANIDVPIPGDYDGDGKTDIAVYQPNIATTYILQSSNGQGKQQQFGIAWDIPVPLDYDGDGHTDIAVFDQGTYAWYVMPSSGKPTTSVKEPVGSGHPWVTASSGSTTSSTSGSTSGSTTSGSTTSSTTGSTTSGSTTSGLSTQSGNAQCTTTGQ